MANENGVKVPSWAVGSIVTVFLAFLGFWGMWSVARADVDGLKGRVSKLESLPETVTGMRVDLQNVKERVEKFDSKLDQLIQRTSR